MEAALQFIIYLLAELLITLNNTQFVLGMTLLQFMVAGSFLFLLYHLIIYILSRSNSISRSVIGRPGSRRQYTSNNKANYNSKIGNGSGPKRKGV